MRGIAGRQTLGLPTMARLHVADNTGAKIVQIVNPLKNHTSGSAGEALLSKAYRNVSSSDSAVHSVVQTARGFNSKTTLV